MRAQATVDRRSAPDPLAALARSRAILLTSFQSDGRPVATPVWFAARDGRLIVTTSPQSGKVKRLRRNPAITVAPCTQRGRATGPAVAGTARLLDADDTRTALGLIRRRYGVLDRLFSLINRLQGQREEIGIEIIPDPTGV